MIDLPLATDRLVLRRFRAGDAKDLFAYLSLPEIYLYEPGQPITLGEAELLCTERESGDSFIAVCLKESNRLIGHLSYHRAEPAYVNTYELGFIFNPLYQRKGYCTEAASAFVQAELATGKVHRIEARCDILNAASWRVLEKSGFTREGLMRKQIYFRTDDAGQPIWVDAYLYAILAEDVRGN
jgi:RimJ/RimL family protein N-acetyltransferase